MKIGRVIFVLIAMFFFLNVFMSETEDKPIQEEASSQYEILKDSFSEDYGGSFIDDSGVLNIYQKENNDDTQTDTTSVEDDVVYIDCEYSYNELLDEMDKIKQYCMNNKDDEITKSIVEFGIYDSENRVKVFLQDDIIDEFKAKVSNSDAIIFEME